MPELDVASPPNPNWLASGDKADAHFRRSHHGQCNVNNPSRAYSESAMIHSLLRICSHSNGLRLSGGLKIRTLSTNSAFLKISAEVQDALQTKKPVVALETTIYTHGFPYPENVALASHLESVVRDNGGVPATIGVLNGVAKVGFELDELDELTSSAGKPDTRKLSRRDLGVICGLGINGRKLKGGTTIAGTMVLAHLAGIKVFATGGLGGVHRGGEDSMDISADLTELGRTPVTVISSGCKSFLDIPRTLEYLETQGVGVGTFADGRASNVDFPAFWTRESGVPSPLVIQDEKEAAAIIYAQMNLPLTSGLLFANPIAAEYSIAKSKMDAIIAEAIQEANQYGASGSDNTPFILKKIRDLAGGSTVIANRALIEANVKRGTKVAVELARLELKYHGVQHRGLKQTANYPGLSGNLSDYTNSECVTPCTSESTVASPAEDIDVVVAGSLAIDLSCDFTPEHSEKSGGSLTPQLHTSNPATISPSLGGVGQNVATALHHLGVSVRLCSAVGDDIAGKAALQMLSSRGLQTSGIVTLENGAHTAQYVAVNDARKDLVMAMADMKLLEDEDCDVKNIWGSRLERHNPKWLVIDGNWDPLTLHKWIVAARELGTKIAFEPVSASKSKRVFHSEETTFNFIDLATPNEIELASMHNQAQELKLTHSTDWHNMMTAIGFANPDNEDTRSKLSLQTNTSLVTRSIPQHALHLLPFIPCLLTKLGPEGVLMTELLHAGDPRLTSPAAAPYIFGRTHTTTNSLLGDIAGVYIRLFPPAEQVPPHEIVSVNGVGDTFLGIIIAGLVIGGGDGSRKRKRLEELVEVAQRGSVMTLKSREAVSSEIADLRPALFPGVG